ncbi:hypothetical protein PsorP6_015588 [Peronosclerospora sorghi]|uniref:Uncharacterized protein n=1 Tax=Peronosclerospora sorghi TaxID=230839 RepID=A0ACC0WNJ6_9STRA|nr:hypothetical protein PsorP6_015588 [Peronosclerospora sorghi]
MCQSQTKNAPMATTANLNEASFASVYQQVSVRILRLRHCGSEVSIVRDAALVFWCCPQKRNDLKPHILQARSRINQSTCPVGLDHPIGLLVSKPSRVRPSVSTSRGAPNEDSLLVVTSPLEIMSPPNVVRAHLYAEAVGANVGLHVTIHTLPCVDKCCGLDNYLLRVKDQRELGVKGLKTRDRILSATQLAYLSIVCVPTKVSLNVYKTVRIALIHAKVTHGITQSTGKALVAIARGLLTRASECQSLRVWSYIHPRSLNQVRSVPSHQARNSHHCVDSRPRHAPSWMTVAWHDIGKTAGPTVEDSWGQYVQARRRSFAPKKNKEESGVERVSNDPATDGEDVEAGGTRTVRTFCGMKSDLHGGKTLSKALERKSSTPCLEYRHEASRTTGRHVINGLDGLD